jgi:two-component system response regulator BaeR
MSDSKTVLIVEDEVKIAQLLRDFFVADGFNATMIHDGKDVVEVIKEQEQKCIAPDLIILDVMLPNKDGLTICKEIRQFSDIPILMLTARVDEIDRLMGLGLGADDYVCKPFSTREVVARVHAILKRTQAKSATASVDLLRYQNITLDQQKFSCTVGDSKIQLTLVEFNLLKTLLSRPGHVFSRDKLMDASYEDSRIVSHRTIDSHMKNLRSKLSPFNAEELIHTIYGVGYKLE